MISLKYVSWVLALALLAACHKHANSDDAVREVTLPMAGEAQTNGDISYIDSERAEAQRALQRYTPGSPEAFVAGFYANYMYFGKEGDSILQADVTSERYHLIKWEFECMAPQFDPDNDPDSLPPHEPICKISEPDSVLYDSAFSNDNPTSDYFYKTNIAFSEWKGHINVHLKTITDSMALLHSVLGADSDTVSLEIILKRRADKWLIDEV